jgi:predicted GIY-YIG superfamily endonuclease
MKPFFVYILHCSDGSYYSGHTDNIETRISQHMQGTLEGYTSARRPLKVVFVQTCESRSEALEAERQIKNWSRRKKESLINEHWQDLAIFAKKHFSKIAQEDL